jgi:hypothetical protein
MYFPRHFMAVEEIDIAVWRNSVKCIDAMAMSIDSIKGQGKISVR